MTIYFRNHAGNKTSRRIMHNLISKSAAQKYEKNFAAEPAPIGKCEKTNG